MTNPPPGPPVFGTKRQDCQIPVPLAIGYHRASRAGGLPTSIRVKNRAAQLKRLACEPSLRDCPAAEHQCEVFGRAAQPRARSVRPVKVGGLQAAPLDAGAEVCL